MCVCVHAGGKVCVLEGVCVGGCVCLPLCVRLFIHGYDCVIVAIVLTVANPCETESLLWNNSNK